jgi:short-subunit dehydrogenase
MNKTVFVTGATLGFGKAIAVRFAAAGYNVVITGRREDRLTQLQQALQQEYNIKVYSLAFDIRDKQAVVKASLI